MRTVLLMALMLTAVPAWAYDAADLQGTWLVVTMQSNKNGQTMEGDGTDFWEFSGTQYSVYSSGLRFSTTEFEVDGDKLIIKAAAGDHVVEIVDIQADTLRVIESGFTYTLTRQ